jgi:hypothetical protein
MFPMDNTPTFTFPALVDLTIEQDLALPSRDPTSLPRPRPWSKSSLQGFLCHAMRGHEQDTSVTIVVPYDCPEGWTTCAAEMSLPSLTTASFPALSYFWPGLLHAPNLTTLNISEPSIRAEDPHFGMITPFQPTPDNRAILAGIRRLDMVCCSCDDQQTLDGWLQHLPNLEILAGRCVQHHQDEDSGLPYDPQYPVTVVVCLASHLTYVVDDMNKRLKDVIMDGLFVTEGELTDLVKKRKEQGRPLRMLEFTGHPLAATECAQLEKAVKFHHVRGHQKFRAMDVPLCGCSCIAGNNCVQCKG